MPLARSVSPCAGDIYAGVINSGASFRHAKPACSQAKCIEEIHLGHKINQKDIEMTNRRSPSYSNTPNAFAEVKRRRLAYRSSGAAA